VGIGLRELALVALGGGVGSALRYLVTGLAQRAAGVAWPVGTLAVNVSGSLLIGFVAGLVATRQVPGEALRLLLVTGVLGGYTTFSAFSLENLLLLRDGQFTVALANAAGQVILGLAAAMAGYSAARLVPAL
jgi:fluoride exporter